ncbi:MAG: hypothetical protein ABI572_11575 [Actinomycetota bacterium]
MAARWRVGGVGRVWALLPVAAPFFVALTATMGAVDLAYHVRVGEQIVASGSLPRVDTFSFTASGTSWLDQQWGAQVLLLAGYRASGWAGLVVLRAALISATCGLVYLACRARGANRRSSSLLTLAGVVVGMRGLALRPQLFVLPLVAGCLWILAGRRAHPRRLAWLPVLAAAMANLHGAFVLVPVIAGLAVVEDVIERDSGVARTLLTGVAATAATLVNPFGTEAWRYAYRIATNPVIRDTISEWRPISVATISGAVFVTSIVLLVLLFIRKGRPVDLAAIAWLTVFGSLAVPASRGIVLWGLVAPTVTARMMPARDEEGPTSSSRLIAAGVIAVAALAAMTVPLWRGTSAEELLTRAPGGLTAAVMREVPAGTDLFVWQPWGSWFEFAIPQDRVFVDSRIELYPAPVWREYGQVRLAEGSWSSILAAYDVGAIVIDAENDTLRPRLMGEPAWTLVYQDGDGSLFVRRDPA